VSPPGQPTSGPGSSAYSHGSVLELKGGSGALAYYLFEPNDPKPASAPVVVFFHGFGFPRASTYKTWIDHIVRKGSSVIFPIYQLDNQPPAAAYVDNGIVAVRDALITLGSRDHVRPQLDRVAFFGHSIGSSIAANIAARAAPEGLPIPVAILLTHAADSGDGRLGTWDSLLDTADFNTIAPDTLVAAVVANDDRVTYDGPSRFILDAAGQIPLANRQLISISSDRHGLPPLQATHDAPTTWTPANALDFFGYWKWGDALLSCAFQGADCVYVFDNTPQETFMGLWSDGVPVVPAEVIDP